MAEKTGAQILWEAMVQEGVEVVFGYPGGAILPAYDAMLEYPDPSRPDTRHEQGASHMADGYARASGKVGVAIATSGPGATNLVTGIATAMLDSVPIVCITGQVASPYIGSDAFQETDVTGVTLPVTKHNYLVTRADEIGPTIREAFYVARSGRPGPVLVDITKDAQINTAEWEPSDEPVRMPGYRPDSARPPRRVRARRQTDQRSRTPADSGGTRHHPQWRRRTRSWRLVNKTNIPVAMTLLGLWRLPG